MTVIFSIKASFLFGSIDKSFNIFLHLSICELKSSISFLYFLFFPNCFFNSFVTKAIVPSGVPNSCAAAAARPPRDFNSCSFDKDFSNLSKALDLFLASADIK